MLLLRAFLEQTVPAKNLFIIFSIFSFFLATVLRE
jgi:hypothetical protein